MMNQMVLIGRIANTPQLKELDDGRKVTNLTLAVPRSFKNANGEYDTDFVDISLWKSIAENTVEYCKKGDLIGVKGRIQTNQIDGKNTMSVVAEKITFLSTRKKNDDDYKNEKEMEM